MNSIGDKIKEYIKKNHMSESDFCEIAGYSQEYLSLVMADQIFPHLEKLERRFKTKFVQRTTSRENRRSQTK